MAKKIQVTVHSDNREGYTPSRRETLEVPDNFLFVQGASLSQGQFTDLQRMPFADRGLAIVAGATTHQSGVAKGPQAALNDYKTLMRRNNVPAHMQHETAMFDWHNYNRGQAIGKPIGRTDVHGADAEAGMMHNAGVMEIAGVGLSFVGFGVAGLAIRGLATGVGALVGRMGASAAASAATKKGVEYAAGAIFGGQYIAEAWKTGGASVTDPWRGKASDKAGLLSTITGGLYGMTGLPDISLPSGIAKGANTTAGILAPALFLGLLPWGRLGKKGGKEGKQEGDFPSSPPFGKNGKRGGFLLMPDVFVDNFQKAVEAISKGMDAFEFKDGKWQDKDPNKRRLFLLPGQRPEQIPTPDPDTEWESGPVIDFAPEPEVIPDPEWNPAPVIDFAPEPDALDPLPLPELLQIPAPEQGPAPWPFHPAPGNWNPGPNIDAAPVPNAPAPRPAEGGAAKERWDRNEQMRFADELEQERQDKEFEEGLWAQWHKKEEWNRRNRHWRQPEPNPRPRVPEKKPKPLPPRPFPGEAPLPGMPVPGVVPPKPGTEVKPIPPGMVPPPEFWNPLPLPGTIPDLEINPGVIPAPLPGAVPAPGMVPAPGKVIPAPVLPKPEVKGKPEVNPKPKPELEPVKPKRMRGVRIGVKEGPGDFGDDEEGFPGIAMRYGNWLPAAPSFHTGQYPLPPYIIKSGRIVYNVD